MKVDESEWDESGLKWMTVDESWWKWMKWIKSKSTHPLNKMNEQRKDAPRCIKNNQHCIGNVLKTCKEWMKNFSMIN